MDETIEVRYAGVVVGRTTAVRGLDASGAFIGLPEPLPVGTLVTVKLAEGTKEARVEEVVESAEPSLVGMRVRFGVGAALPAPAANSTSAPGASAPAAEAQGDLGVGAQPVAVEGEDSSGDHSAPLEAPLSLAGPSGGGNGSGKKRRKRR